MRTYYILNTSGSVMAETLAAAQARRPGQNFVDEEGQPIREAAPGINIYTFASTGEAYGACQTREDVQTGDILLIPSEKVIGVADTWPFAVTRSNGLLHTLRLGVLEAVLRGDAPTDWTVPKRSIELALQLAQKEFP